MRYHLTFLSAFLAFLAATPLAHAKRVICIAPQNNGYDHHLEAGEGYYRSNPEPGDIIDDSGNLQACLDQLVDGDKFILIAHGTPGHFEWNGTTYRGFGPAPDQFHAMGINDVMVTICVQACHSNEQPSLPVQQPLRDNLAGAFQEGSTATGWTGEVEFPCKMPITYDSDDDPDYDPKNPLSQAEIDARIAAAGDCLADDTSWAEESWDAQEAAAQAVIDECEGTAGISINFTWCPPQVRAAGTGDRGGDIEIVFGCGQCPLPGCGYATYIIPGPADPIPTTSQWGLITFALLTLTGGTIIVRRRRAITPETA